VTWKKIKNGRSGAPHGIVSARAGTGKTFTMIEGINRVLGTPTSGVVGTDEQESIWSFMAQGDAPATITMIAFNRAIAAEAKSKIPTREGVTASTFNSFGFKTYLRGTRGKVKLEKFKVRNLIDEFLTTDTSQNRAIAAATANIVGKAKATLTGNWDGTTYTIDRDELRLLQARFAVDCNGHEGAIFELVPRVLARCIEMRDVIDFDDQIWLPHILGMAYPMSDLLIVDEAQDMNRCQAETLLRAGRRIIAVGDEFQAIYGFRGADTQSMERLESLLSDDPRGCEVYSLTATRRCPASHVELVQPLVGDITAMAEAPDGRIDEVDLDGMMSGVRSGDMVLCRTNAPLVSAAFRLISKGVKAVIQGRDIGDGLLRLVDKLADNPVVSTVADLGAALDDYGAKEFTRLSKSRHSGALLQSMQDRCDCIRALCHGRDSIDAVRIWIRDVFADVFPDGKPRVGVLLSSVHRAKGLESDTVYILNRELMPHPMAKLEWERAQEKNIEYVAKTRSRDRLVFVVDEKEMEDE